MPQRATLTVRSSTARGRTAPVSRVVQRERLFRLAPAVGLLAVFFWSYMPTLAFLWRTWQNDGDYSAGQLVPVVFAYVLWSRRKLLSQLEFQPCWWGLVVLLGAQAIRLGGLLLSYGSAEPFSLVLTVFGVFLLIAGRRFTRWIFWPLVFLFLMAPLPRRVHAAVALPLQSFATTSAVFGLELFGYLVSREGNVLKLPQGTAVNVAEACSGLRMLTAFVVVASAMAFAIRAPKWLKAALALSSLPVGVLSNSLRLLVTVLLHESLGGEAGQKFLHDFAGLTMMPLAVLILLGELRLLRWIEHGQTGSGGRPATALRAGAGPVRPTA